MKIRADKWWRHIWVYSQYWISLILPERNSTTKRLPLGPTHKPQIACKWQLSMKRRNCPSWSRMWIQWLSPSPIRIQLWLSVERPTGVNDFLLLKGEPVYVNRDFRSHCPSLLRQLHGQTHNCLDSCFLWYIWCNQMSIEVLHYHSYKFTFFNVPCYDSI